MYLGRAVLERQKLGSKFELAPVPLTHQLRGPIVGPRSHVMSANRWHARQRGLSLPLRLVASISWVPVSHYSTVPFRFVVTGYGSNTRRGPIRF